jgi:hypothetical protein
LGKEFQHNGASREAPPGPFGQKPEHGSTVHRTAVQTFVHDRKHVHIGPPHACHHIVQVKLHANGFLRERRFRNECGGIQFQKLCFRNRPFVDVFFHDREVHDFEFVHDFKGAGDLVGQRKDRKVHV